jgi:hypothetical protein
MSLPDLLNWASVNRRTGILELERKKICKRIAFRDGHIVACSSDDPPALLGQFLLSRGKIDHDTLRTALERQETTGENLGTILEELGALPREEIESQVAAKAEENIYGLFDWTDAVFRFLENAPVDPNTIEVNLSVEEIMIRGAQRKEDLERVRKVFPSSGIVLRRTDRPTPNEVLSSPMAHRILDSINGERSVAEILLHAHASEYLVIKFLFSLYSQGVIEIAGERPVDPQAATLLDVPEAQTASPAEEPPGEKPGEAAQQQVDLSQEIENVQRLMSEGRYDAALDILNDCYRTRPDDNYLRHLALQAESGYLQSTRQGALSPAKIPVLLVTEIDPADSKLQPTELFLLSMLDGETDIKSLIWIAPLREVDLLRALQHMLDEGVIELRDPDASQQEQTEGAPVKAVQWSPV